MKKALGLLLAAACIMTTFAGCSQNVTLKSALENSSKITSCSYNISFTGDVGQLAGKVAGKTAGSSSMTINMNGKAMTENGRTKAEATVKADVGGSSTSVPVWIDSAQKAYDFNLYAGIPDVLKTSMYGMLDNYKYLYLSSSTLDSYLKKYSSSADYAKYKSAVSNIGQNSPAIIFVNDLKQELNDFITKDKTGVKAVTFKEIQNKPKSSNGVYTIKVTRESMKAFVGDYFGNATYYKHFCDYIKTINQDSATKSAKDEIAEMNKNIDAGLSDTSTLEFTITDNYVTNIAVNMSYKDSTSGSGSAALKLTVSLSDINKVSKIDFPSKSDKETLDVEKLLESLNNLGNLANSQK